MSVSNKSNSTSSAINSNSAEFNYDSLDSFSSDLEDDFLAGLSANPVPSACSLDSPDCEACQ